MQAIAFAKQCDVHPVQADCSTTARWVAACLEDMTQGGYAITESLAYF